MKVEQNVTYILVGYCLALRQNSSQLDVRANDIVSRVLWILMTYLLSRFFHFSFVIQDLFSYYIYIWIIILCASEILWWILYSKLLTLHYFGLSLCLDLKCEDNVKVSIFLFFRVERIFEWFSKTNLVNHEW